MAVGKLVDPAEAGKVVVSAVGVAPPTTTGTLVVLVAAVVPAAVVPAAVPGRHWEYHSLE